MTMPTREELKKFIKSVDYAITTESLAGNKSIVKGLRVGKAFARVLVERRGVKEVTKE